MIGVCRDFESGERRRTSVNIVSAYPNSPLNFIASQVRGWVSENEGSGFVLASTPETADLILFIEHHPAEDPLFFGVLLHPLRRSWPSKTFLFHDADTVFPLMPGIYPSLDKRFAGAATASWFYAAQFCRNDEIQNSAVTGEEEYLYSFCGAGRTHPIRERILQLKDGRALLRDTSAQNGWELSGKAQEQYHKDFARIITKSKFVLCPRGISPNSYRLLEAMQAGRAPVIISDDWIFPKGPDWKSFSIVVRESEIEKIPQILRGYEAGAAELGGAARAAWEHWCADNIKHQRLLERLEALAGAGRLSLKYRLGVWKRILTTQTGLRAFVRSVRTQLNW